MTKKIIECEDCGSQQETARSNTLYCSFHRFLRNFMFARSAENNTHVCRWCEKKFMRVMNNQGYCAECFPPYPTKKSCKCLYCKQEKGQIHDDIHICRKCADDPANDRSINKKLKANHEWLKRHPVVLKTDSEPSTDDDAVPDI